MTKIATTRNNFARARLDKDLGGRYDLGIYNTGAEQFTNFISNFKGNAIYRTGFELQESFQDCVFVEFEFSQEQSYLCLFYENLVKFLTYDSNGNFGFVQSGGSDLEVISPYTLAQAREMQWDQNADVMKMVHPDVAPQDFVRTSATSFAFSDSTTTGADWSVTTESDIIPTMTSNSTPAGTVISATYNNADAYKMFDDNDTTIWDIDAKNTLPESFTAQKVASDTVVSYTIRVGTDGDLSPSDWNLEGSNDGIAWTLIDSQTGVTWGNNEKKKFDLSASSTFDYHRITISASNNSNDYIEIKEVEYLEQDTTGSMYPSSVLFKDGRLIYSRQTTVWFSEAGDYEEFTIPGTIVADSPIKLTVADLTEEIQWLFSSERSIIGGNRKNIITINGGDVNTPLTAENVSVSITSADGSNDTIPVRKDGLVFYIGRNSRNAFYFRYDLLGEAFKSDDANFVSYDITKEGISKLKYKKDRNDLIYTIRGDGQLLALNFNQEEKIVGWSVQETDGTIQDIAVISNNEGDQQLFALVVRDSVYYIERLHEFIEFSDQEDFFTGNVKDDAEAYQRLVGEQLKNINHLDNSECVNNLQESNTITYDSGAGTITATSAVFSSGDVDKFIEYKTETGYEKGRFKITGYTSTTVVEVDEVITPSSNTYDDWYLTFDTLTGLSRFNGESISVVGDGSYLGEFTVSGGSLSLDRQLTSVCVGIKYTGLIKTFNLGFAMQGENTIKNQKNIFQVGMSYVDSAGGLVGTTRYRMEEVQEIKDGTLNYLPPTLLDGVKNVSYNDTSNKNKHLYIEQDKPLPMTVTSVIIDTNYGVTR